MWRPRALRGRARDREDGPRARDRPVDRRRSAVACPVHARSAAERRHRALDLQPEASRVRVPAGADLRQRRPRRRDQPRDAEDAGRTPRGDGRAAGHDRRADPEAAEPVSPARDGEPDRVRGHVPAARGAARPVLPEDLARLSLARRRAADHRRPARAAPARDAPTRRDRRGGGAGRRRGARRLPRSAARPLDRRARAGDEGLARRSPSGPPSAAASRSSGRPAAGR